MEPKNDWFENLLKQPVVEDTKKDEFELRRVEECPLTQFQDARQLELGLSEPEYVESVDDFQANQ